MKDALCSSRIEQTKAEVKCHLHKVLWCGFVETDIQLSPYRSGKSSPVTQEHTFKIITLCQMHVL